MNDKAAVLDGETETPTLEPRVPVRLHAIKEADTFLVADEYGDISGEGDGLFASDTRVISELRLSLGGHAPSLLSGGLSEDNVFFHAHLTNRPLPPLGGRSMPQGVIHVERTRFIWGDRLFEKVSCINYADREAGIPLSFSFAADFRDMFEVRGSTRPARGSLLAPQVSERSVCFAYQGLDRVKRESTIAFSLRPDRISEQRADFYLVLPDNGHAELFIEITPNATDEVPSRERFRHAAAKARVSMRNRRRRGARLKTSNGLFTQWLDKSRADLALLTTDLPTGPYPYAGIPWFSTPFGRDAIITSLQTLWLDPSLARGVLTYLASNQAREVSAFQDAAPGKIMHETRKGEMTATRELPFAQYYGGVDTTPLFLMLAGAYADRTGDLTLIRELWPALEAAMGWIESVCARNANGLLDYARAERSGLANQGWKDSEDSVFHASGEFPRGPISLVEVQGYVYCALRSLAALTERRGDLPRAAQLSARATELRERIEKLFWMDDAQFFGLAIDGEGQLCRVRSSNAGQLLFCEVPSKERALPVIRQLLSSSFDNGWGVRTLADDEARFNPMSYHNGSVWPHDSSLCAAGMAKYGERDGVVHLIGELFQTAVHFGMRLPELFCGFPRRAGQTPIAYPVACLPQAWAAGSVFMLLQSCLGIQIDGWRKEIRVHEPRLPDGVVSLTISRLGIGPDRVDLVFQRIRERIVVFPQNRVGNIVVVTQQ